jgi:hypothetical protein
LDDISINESKVSSPTIAATTVETTPSPNNHHVNVTTKIAPIQPPKEQQIRLNGTKSQSPPLYSPIPPIAPPHVNIQKFQTPTFYPQIVIPQINMIRSQPALYCLPKEQIQQIQLKKEKFQPLPIIDPKNRKQIVVERNYPIINLKEQVGQSALNNVRSRLYNQNREFQKLNYVIPDMKIESKYIPTTFPTTELWFDHLNSLRYFYKLYLCIFFINKI